MSRFQHHAERGARIGQDMIVLVVEKNYAEEKMWKLSSSLSRFLTSIYSDLESAVTDVE